MLPNTGLQRDEQQGHELLGQQQLEQHEQHDLQTKVRGEQLQQLLVGSDKTYLQQYVQSQQSKTWTGLELLGEQLELHGLLGQHEQLGQREQGQHGLQGLREQQGLREVLGEHEQFGQPHGLGHRVSLQRCMSIRTELESERRLQWGPNVC